MRLLAALVLIMSLLAACGDPAAPTGPTPIAPQPGVTPDAGDGRAIISFGAWEYELSIYRPLAEKFNAENPNIEVVIVPIDEIFNTPPSDDQQSVTSSLRRLVAMVDTATSFTAVPEAFNTPLLLNMRPLMEADPNFDRSDFYPGTIERWTAQDGVWVLPRFFYISLLNYNRDLLQSGGETPAPQSWGALLDLAEASTVASGANVTSYGWIDTSSGFLPFLALLERKGVNPFAIPVDEIDLTDPVYVEALTDLRRLTREGVIYNAYGGAMPLPGPASGAVERPYVDPGQLVREGRAAIWGDLYIAGPDGTPEDLPFTIGQMAYPASPLTDSFLGGGGDGYIISGGTAYPNESWRWIEWLSRQMTDMPGSFEPGFAPVGRIPARETLAQQLGFWDAIDPAIAEIYRSVLARATPPTATQTDYSLQSAFSQAIGMITNDPNVDPRQALADAQRVLREQREQFLLTPTPAPDVRPVIVATPEPQTAPEGATTINFSAYGYSPSNLRPIIRAFREQRPDIFVNVSTPEFVAAPTVADIAATADCFIWGEPLQNDADFDAVLDLQPLIDADASFPLDDYPQALISAFQHDGRTLALPLSFSLRTLNYNRTMLDELGVRPPTGDWTPDDFLTAAQALTTGEGENRRYGYVSISGVAQDLVFWTGQFGGRLTTGSGMDLRPNYTDPNVVSAIQWYLDLARIHQVMPEFKLIYDRDDTNFEDRSYEYVQNGRAGLWFDYGYGFFGGGIDGPIPPERPFEVGIAPLPSGGGGLRTSDLFARGAFISAGAQNPEACWEWTKFLSNDLSLLYGSIPARRSVAESEAFAAQSSPETREVYEIYADTLARPAQPGDSVNALYSQQLDLYWLFKAIMTAYTEDADLATELAEAQRLTTLYAECVAGGDQPPQCALQADPTYNGFNVDQPPAQG
jgi:ABC-type glycerol-3-phosphate transport system substrate-binding protein